MKLAQATASLMFMTFTISAFGAPLIESTPVKAGGQKGESHFSNIKVMGGQAPDLTEVHRELPKDAQVDFDRGVLEELSREDIYDQSSETDWQIIKSIPSDLWATIRAPGGWNKEEWLIAGGVVGMTVLIIQADERAREFVQKNKNEFTEELSYYAEKGGNREVVFSLGAAYLVGIMLKNPKLKRAATLAFSSLLVSGAITQAMKYAFARARPNKELGAEKIYGLGSESLEHRSLPSGHTTAAFSIAASLSESYKNPWVSILAYAAASLVGWSRIHDDKHWTSDVFLGAAIGTATGIFVTRRHKNHGDDGLILAPWGGRDEEGNTVFGVHFSMTLQRKPRR